MLILPELPNAANTVQEEIVSTSEENTLTPLDNPMIPLPTELQSVPASTMAANSTPDRQLTSILGEINPEQFEDATDGSEDEDKENVA